MDRSAITIETYNNSAKQYEEKFMHMDLYNDTYDKFCELIKTHDASVFEIACGPGNITRYLLQKRPDFKIFGIDLSPNMISLAKENNPSANFQVMDCRKISTMGAKYHAIMCGFCMPYLSKEECSMLIQDCSNLLFSNGILYFSTMEGDYSKSGYETTSFSGHDKVYIYYHEADLLSEELCRNGFHIIEIQRKDYPEPDGSYLTDMIFLARKVL